MTIVYVLLVLVVLAVVGLLTVALANKRREPDRKAAWAHISSLVRGTFSTTSGLTSGRHKIDGTYETIPVEVSVEGHDAGDDPVFYTYHLKIKTSRRQDDWTLRFGVASPEPDRNWHVESRNEKLSVQLAESIAIEVARMHPCNAQVRYRIDSGTLEYKKPIVGDTSVPTLDEFKLQFGLLRQLAELNKKLNEKT